MSTYLICESTDCNQTFVRKSGNRNRYCSRECQYTSRRGYKSFTDDTLRDAVKDSLSWTEVCEKVSGGLRNGSIHRKVRQKCKDLSIDTSHLLYPTGRRDPENWKRRSIDELFKMSNVKSGHLRKRLIQEGYKELYCEQCKLDIWQGLPITLELHHIDGNHSNNSLNNLKILCCNCHALTDSWRTPFKKRRLKN